MKYFFILLVSFTSVSQTSGWNKDLEILIDGTTRYYDVYVPSNLNQNPALVIQLHGGTQSKEEIYNDNAGASKYWKDVAEKEHFLLIVPNGTNIKTGAAKGNNLNWNDCRVHPNDNNADDVGFISKLIDIAIENYKVNNKKVFVTGVSNGGLMCYRLGLEIPNRITAIAAFNANLSKESECKLSNIPISVMIVNGVQDKFMPFYGGKSKFRKDDFLSSQETVDFWVKNNFKGTYISKDIIKYNTAEMQPITLTIYNKENQNNQIQYYEIKDGGHTMPGKKYVLSRFIQRIVGKQNESVEGAEIAWEFFKNVSK